MDQTTRRTRTDTLAGQGSGPTALELNQFLLDCPPEGQITLTTDSGDQREGSSWSITVTSTVGAKSIRDRKFH